MAGQLNIKLLVASERKLTELLNYVNLTFLLIFFDFYSANFLVPAIFWLCEPF